MTPIQTVAALFEQSTARAVLSDALQERGHNVTAAQIRALVEARIEKSEPADSILAYLQKRNGQQLTKRDETRMRAEIDDSIRIYKSAGMTNIEWGGYTSTRGNGGGSLLVAYAIQGVTIDAAWVEGRNPAFFSARKERNAKRLALLADPGDVFERCAAAINTLNAAREELDSLIEYDRPLDTERYEIRKLVKE